MSKFMLAQFDNCMPDFDEVRTKVLEDGFKSQVGPDGFEYKHISLYPVDHWISKIEENLGHEIIPRLTFFRQDWDGEMPHSYVHSDDICATYASVLYMNTYEQCQGGTTFWMHKQTGLEEMPSDKELEATGQSPIEFGTRMNEWWKDPLAWIPISYTAMKPNRFITYPTSRFHSRWPWKAFGTTPEEARMIWVLFYDFA